MGISRGWLGQYIEYDNPVIWAGAAWIIAVLSWLLAPDRVVYYFVPNGRYATISSVGFFCLCFVAFGLGLSIGMGPGKRSRPGGLVLRDAWEDRATAALVLRKMAVPCRWFVWVALLCQAVHVWTMILGGGQELDIDSIVQYRSQYHGAAIKGLTIFKFLSLPAFVMALIGAELAKNAGLHRQRVKFRIAAAFTLLVPVTSGILGTRLIPLMWLVPYFYLKVAMPIRLKGQKLGLGKMVRLVLALLLIFSALYSAGNYVRHYKKVSVGELEVTRYAQPNEGFFKYTFLTFLSYPFRTINNGLVIVDHIDRHAYFWRSLRWLYSGLGIERIDPGGLIASVKENMNALDFMGLAFFGATNASMPGYLFLDLGWFAVGILFEVGWFVGLCYRLWRRTNVLGWFVVPLLIVPLLDSWRTDILFRSMNMVALIGAVGAGIFLKRELRRVRLPRDEASAQHL